jgi:hypothetical protein
MATGRERVLERYNSQHASLSPRQATVEADFSIEVRNLPDNEKGAGKDTRSAKGKILTHLAV